MGTIYLRAAQGGTNRADTTKVFRFYKSNFNMPVPNIFYNTGVWPRETGTGNGGPYSYIGSSNSFNFLGQTDGHESWLGTAIYDWAGPLTGSTVNIYIEVDDPSGNPVLSSGAVTIAPPSLPSSSYWYEAIEAYNIGLKNITPHEINVDGNYNLKAHALTLLGDSGWTITETNLLISCSNVPNNSILTGSEGALWVEGSNLCYVGANHWKHSMTGNFLGAVGTDKAGAIWIGTASKTHPNESLYGTTFGVDCKLHWVGSDGLHYEADWAIKQFASTFTNGAPINPSPGSAYAGYIWVDDEFGKTHIGYIGSDGNKYITGDGEWPYDSTAL